ncbi:retrovirus-related pol polyprotein from transposon TNT 1-94 [Tanacetum coccineum]
MTPHQCSLGKSKKHTHKPKSENNIQDKLYLLHMDICGPMRVKSINGKKYILVIMDDYSSTVRLNATVKNIRTDNGTEFVNQTLKSYYEDLSQFHDTTGIKATSIKSLKIVQDAPSASTSPTSQETQSPVIHPGVEEQIQGTKTT